MKGGTAERKKGREGGRSREGRKDGREKSEGQRREREEQYILHKFK